MKVRVNGVDIAYDDHGIGQPVIFLHAFPLNRGMWQEQMTGLLDDQRYRLVALDWRGFGESEIANDVSTMEMFADDVAALMDMLGMEQAIICGLSMGGYAAFAFLRKYAHRVRGLILADTRPGADNDEGKANRERIAQLAESRGSEAIANALLPNLIANETRQNQPAVEAKVRRIIDAATSRGIAAASRGMALRVDAADLLPSIACPTLVLVGQHDALTPPAVAQSYAASIPGTQVRVIAGAGHLANLEQPEAFLEAMRHFLLSSFEV
ncbi:MAG TPA: alpha/beta fold hydrolase [Ktedonobacteraceae bacterium]|nr:alpha/beta fold hydrolase [Ktedonobacteraceae bacterium]